MADQQNTPTPAPDEPVRETQWVFLIAGLLLAMGTVPVVFLYEVLVDMGSGYAADEPQVGVWIYRGIALAWTAVPGLLIGVGAGGTTAQVSRHSIIATVVTALPVLMIMLA